MLPIMIPLQCLLICSAILSLYDFDWLQVLDRIFQCIDLLLGWLSVCVWKAPKSWWKIRVEHKLHAVASKSHVGWALNSQWWLPTAQLNTCTLRFLWKLGGAWKGGPWEVYFSPYNYSPPIWRISKYVLGEEFWRVFGKFSKSYFSFHNVPNEIFLSFPFPCFPS